MHIPAPSHFASVESEVDPTGQLPGMHTVPAGCSAQAPLPSQVPSVPQVEAAMARHSAFGSAPPSGMAVQAPSASLTAHEVQMGQLALPQQTPSTQWPLTHCEPSSQILPLPRRSVHDVPWQVKPITQSPSSAQVVRHVVCEPQT